MIKKELREEMKRNLPTVKEMCKCADQSGKLIELIENGHSIKRNGICAVTEEWEVDEMEQDLRTCLEDGAFLQKSNQNLCNEYPSEGPIAELENNFIN